MAMDQFLKIDGVKGEAKDHKHKEEIDVLAEFNRAELIGEFAP